MKQFFKGLLLGLAFLPTLILAHGAPRITVEEHVVINAEPAVVWNTIKNFDSAHTWIPAVEATEASGNDKGATRTLTLKGGATVSEKLKKFDNEKMTFMYEITDISKAGEVDDQGEMHEVPAFPVSKYKSWVSVTAVDGGSKVSWKGKFFRAYHGKHHPPKELDDDAAKNAVTGLYTSTLKSLKASLEK
jgi:mxaD protein